MAIKEGYDKLKELLMSGLNKATWALIKPKMSNRHHPIDPKTGKVLPITYTINEKGQKRVIRDVFGNK